MEPFCLASVGSEELRGWLVEGGPLRRLTAGIGRAGVPASYLEEQLRLPAHLAFTARALADEDPHATYDDLCSIPFYSLCRGLFLPLSSLQPERVALLFGFQAPPPPRAAERQELLRRFFAADVGLTIVQKLSCVLGDPFRGGRSRVGRDSLIRLLQSVQLQSRSSLLDRLTVLGDVAALYAEARPKLRVEPPLTAAEVLETLRLQAKAGIRRSERFALLRSLLERCGKLEAYFFAQLLLRKAGFGFQYEGSLLATVLAEHFGVMPEAVQHAMALTDPFQVARVLEEEGAEGLRKIRLQPLVAVRPALASGQTSKIDRFPVWVERKYDGIRFMLHKDTDARGGVLTGAYTRTRRDWLDLVPQLPVSIRALPARSVILDGELHGTVLDLEGARPATVYEVYASLQGQAPVQVNLRFAAFDLCYLNGTDLTPLPLTERRRWLEQLITPLASLPLPIPIELAAGQLANDMNDVNRLYQHFRAQGYEGVITKQLDGPYRLASRDPGWLKRKPAITLDLVLLGAVFAVTQKQNVGAFGSYVIGARGPDGGFVDVGDVAAMDKVRDGQIQAEIMRGGLITGKRIERQSASGTRPGMELRPGVVITVRFEGIVKDYTTGSLKLRDPKAVAIRTDKAPEEVNSMRDIEELYLRQRVG